MACFGKAKWESVKNNTVLCSGTSMGTKVGMHRYFDVMLAEIAERVALTEKEANCPGWFGDKCDCRTGGVDQGYHNFLFHSGRFGPTAVAIPNTDGVVLTAGFLCNAPDVFNAREDALSLMLDKDGYVTYDKSKEKRVAVVHQWDRCNPQPRGWHRS